MSTSYMASTTRDRPILVSVPKGMALTDMARAFYAFLQIPNSSDPELKGPSHVERQKFWILDAHGDFRMLDYARGGCAQLTCKLTRGEGVLKAIKTLFEHSFPPVNNRG